MKRLLPPLRHVLKVALGLLFAGNAFAATIDFTANLATPVIKAGQSQTTFLKVGLTGLALPAQGERPAANVALVIDKSGSMQGERIERAKEAAVMAVQGLSADDIVAVIAFDNTIEVVTPATKVTDKEAITRAIRTIRPGGSTGLFAGVSKGAQEVRKFLAKTRVNRVILLSDGQANSGPSSPSELGQLGAMLGRDGISVTTIGLGNGYNEDLMTQLAGYSDGNHAFAQNSADLARIFQREFGDVGTVVAQEIEVTIRLKRGIRALRILGREGDIADGLVRLRMNQLYSQQEKYVVLEVEVPAGKGGDNFELAAVELAYLNMQSKSKDQVSRAVAVSFSESQEAVAKATDKRVMVSAVQQVSNQMNKEALALRDKGQVEEAKKAMEKTASYLDAQSASLGEAAEALKPLQAETRSQARTIDSKDAEQWNVQRKQMKEGQFKLDKQQR